MTGISPKQGIFVSDKVKNQKQGLKWSSRYVLTTLAIWLNFSQSAVKSDKFIYNFDQGGWQLLGGQQLLEKAYNTCLRKYSIIIIIFLVNHNKLRKQ